MPKPASSECSAAGPQSIPDVWIVSGTMRRAADPRAITKSRPRIGSVALRGSTSARLCSVRRQRPTIASPWFSQTPPAPEPGPAVMAVETTMPVCVELVMTAFRVLGVTDSGSIGDGEVQRMGVGPSSRSRWVLSRGALQLGEAIVRGDPVRVIVGHRAVEHVDGAAGEDERLLAVAALLAQRRQVQQRGGE